jgi:transposase
VERRQRRKFTPQFKARTVDLVRSSGRPIAQICRELDLTETAVRRWVLQAEIDAGQREGLSSTEREELARLRKENRVLREEREILRKAAAFFARQDETR